MGSPLPPLATKPRQVPYHWQEAGEKVIDELVNQDLISRVKDYTPACAHGFFAKKPHNVAEPRLVIDFKPLNDSIPRACHPVPNPHQIVKDFPPNQKYFI